MPKDHAKRITVFRIMIKQKQSTNKRYRFLFDVSVYEQIVFQNMFGSMYVCLTFLTVPEDSLPMKNFVSKTYVFNDIWEFSLEGGGATNL